MIIHTRNRSLLSYSSWKSRRHVAGRLKLLRILDVVDSYSLDEILWLINSRYISCTIPRDSNVTYSFSLLWNLQTLVLCGPISLPPQFWRMPQLRHLKIPGITLPRPSDDQSLVVLENLQTLKTIKDFVFCENVLRRIPYLKKLGVDCRTSERIISFGLSNLASLDKLECLFLKSREPWENMAFLHSLKKLTLSHCQIPWEDMSIVGSLPNLEVLKLLNRAAAGKVWAPNEDEFCRLKFLLIDWCQLEIWEACGSHFPSLEQLQLVRVRMEVFPFEFSEIETLKTIDLNYCSKALLLSAKEMSGERRDLDYEDIQIRSFPSQASRSREHHVVGLEDEVEKLIGYLSEECEELDVISIVGQGGLGKTTLAHKIFNDPVILHMFYIHIWITVSENLCERNLFLSILREFTTLTEDIHLKSDEELANLTRVFLDGDKFILVLDDLWAPEDWDRIRHALPRQNKKSKVLITSRHIDVCWHANRLRAPHGLRFLTREESWLLLRLEVFGEAEFVWELEAEGKLIAEQCRGLPLAVALVGGVLAKKLSASNEASDVMKAILRDVSASFNADLDILSVVMHLSYDTLPYHLRKCFLYVGMFPRDHEIPVWKLVRMWIAEGFIQREDNISLEETAEKYLDDLISSNLLRADKLDADGRVKVCKIHNVLRDLCFRKATEKNQIFFKEIRSSPSDSCTPLVSEEDKYQRICIHSNVLNFLSGRPYCPSVGSFVCFSKEDYVVHQEHTFAIPAGFKLMRVLDIMPLKINILPSNIYHLLHLKYMAISFNSAFLPAAFSEFRNIQTLVVDTTSRTLDVRACILDMIELRHFKTNASATLAKPDTSSEGGENIQTLGMISPETCTEEVFGRARNLKKLGIRGKLALLLECKNRSFNSLKKLENLEKLRLINDTHPHLTSQLPLRGLPPAEAFPIKLRSLTLCETFLDWSHMCILGSLENLEVLKLQDYAFQGMLWEASGDGGFPHLQLLQIGRTDLKVWVASQDHFPRLKRLELRNCEELVQVPLELADILSFRRLDLFRCESAVPAAREIAAKKHAADSFHLSIFPLQY